MNLWSLELWPYLIPLGLVLSFATMQLLLLLVGGISFDLDADMDVDLDVDVDLDMDVDLDADVDVDADVDAGGHGGGPGLLVTVLSPLGLGKVPLTILLQAFGLSWGLTGGLTSYALFAQYGQPVPWFLAVTIPASLAGGAIGTKLLVRMLAPLFKVTGKAESHADLIGRLGRVTSLQVDAEYGEVCLETNGTPNYVVVRGQGELSKRGDTVIVVGFDVGAQRPVVALKEELLQHQAPTSEGV